MTPTKFKILDKKFLMLFCIIALFFAVTSYYYYQKTVQEDSSISMVDFRVYYYAGFRLEMNTNIYDTNDGYFIYKYSPIFALIMSVIKFSTRTPADALCVWYIILFISFIASLYLIKEILFYPQNGMAFRFFDIIPILFIFRYLILINFTYSYIPYHLPLPVRIYDLALLYVLSPIYLINLVFTYRMDDKANYLPVVTFSFLFVLRSLALNIDRAQINIVILLLLLFFCYYLINNQDLMAGVYLGIAIIFKLSPIVFWIYLIIKKRFKIFYSSLATFIALLFIPSFRWGIARNMDLIKGWFNALRITFPSEYLQHKNQSLMAAISRFFSKNSDVSIIKLDDVYLTTLIALIYGACISILIYIIMKKRTASTDRDEIILDLSLFFIAMTILSPVGTKTTFVYIILPIVLLVNEAFKRRFRDKFINTGLLTYVSLVYLNSPDIIGELSITLHKYSLMTLCILIIFSLTAHIKFSSASTHMTTMLI